MMDWRRQDRAGPSSAGASQQHNEPTQEQQPWRIPGETYHTQSRWGQKGQSQGHGQSQQQQSLRAGDIVYVNGTAPDVATEDRPGWIPATARGHPALIVALDEVKGTATVMVVTHFGGKTLSEKFRIASSRPSSSSSSSSSSSFSTLLSSPSSGSASSPWRPSGRSRPTSSSSNDSNAWSSSRKAWREDFHPLVDEYLAIGKDTETPFPDRQKLLLGHGKLVYNSYLKTSESYLVGKEDLSELNGCRKPQLTEESLRLAKSWWSDFQGSSIAIPSRRTSPSPSPSSFSSSSSSSSTSWRRSSSPASTFSRCSASAASPSPQASPEKGGFMALASWRARA